MTLGSACGTDTDIEGPSNAFKSKVRSGNRYEDVDEDVDEDVGEDDDEDEDEHEDLNWQQPTAVRAGLLLLLLLLRPFGRCTRTRTQRATRTRTRPRTHDSMLTNLQHTA